MEPHRTQVLDTRFFFLHSFLRSLCSSFSPYTSPTDSSNLSTGATTQTHEFIISWHQSKTQTQKSRSRHQSNNSLSLGLLISTPKQLGFVDLDTKVRLGLMFLFGIVAQFFFFFFFFLGLLSSEVGLGF